MRTSATVRGNDFRDRVCAMMQAAGFVAKTEVRVGHKKVDIFAEKFDYGRLKKYAVECKFYDAALTKNQSIAIVADYSPLKEQRLVDEIWVIGRSISSDARLHLESIDRFRVFSVDELKSSIADFSAYIQHLIDMHDRAEVAEYYIRILHVDGTDIEQYVLNWISNDDETPIAIEAGYGKGKTTFSLHLANKLALVVRANPNARIPIYVPLGEVATEQSASGLISTVLANLPFVSNYSFKLIETLNNEGCFVFIFDGFDEMKHGMSFEQLRYNFSEILRLWSKKSKIMVLGRPTAFLSDGERAFIFGGVDCTSIGQEFRDSRWPRFKVFNIADWSLMQAGSFIRKYFPIASRQHGAITSTIDAPRRVSRLLGGDYNELIVRPVHAKMLVEVSSEQEEVFEKLSTYHLYDRFIHGLLRREIDKKGRDKKIGVYARRDFATRVAWWMWSQSGLRSTRVEKIPEGIIQHFVSAYPAYEERELRRELIAGCFIDKNDSSAIYFPHRSFQEFLVSVHLIYT